MSEVTRRYELIKWLTLYFDIMPSKAVEIIEQLKKSLSPQPQIDVEEMYVDPETCPVESQRGSENPCTKNKIC